MFSAFDFSYICLLYFTTFGFSDELRQCKIRISYTDDENIRYRSEANSFLCTPGSEKAQVLGGIFLQSLEVGLIWLLDDCISIPY